jgi:hypothetical protein
LKSRRLVYFFDGHHMENWVLYNPTKIIFGVATVLRLSNMVPQDARVLILLGGVSAKKNGTLDAVKKAPGARVAFRERADDACDRSGNEAWFGHHGPGDASAARWYFRNFRYAIRARLAACRQRRSPMAWPMRSSK